MAEKILNTRIQLRYDTYANWTSANTLLKAGEVAIATVSPFTNTVVPEGKTEGHPVLFKVGPGNFNDLPWASALAADVHSWAKKSETDFTTWVKSLIEVTDIDAYSKSEIDQKFTNNSAADQKYAKDYADGLASNYDAAGAAASAQAAAIADAEGKIAALKNGDVKANTDAIAAIKNHDSVDSFGDVMTEMAKYQLAGDYATKTEAQGYANAKDEAIAAAQKAGDDAQSDVDALELDMGDVDGLSTTNKTVVGAINEVLAAVGTGGTAAVVTITTDTTTEGALKSYTVKQGDATVGVIDIPKDMVVQSGEVVTNPDGQPAGTYIKLVLANATNDEIFVNVGNLVDIYKAKANAAQVQLAIDSTTREISASIVAGSVTATELAANAVTTEKIANANVTKDKLSSTVQASLEKADTAVQPAALDNYYTKSAADAEFMNSAETGSAIDAKITALNLATTYEPIGAESRAKAYADGLAGNYATAAQGAKADTAMQPADHKVSTLIQDEVLVFNCGDAAGNPLV